LGNAELKKRNGEIMRHQDTELIIGSATTTLLPFLLANGEANHALYTTLVRFIEIHQRWKIIDQKCADNKTGIAVLYDFIPGCSHSPWPTLTL